MSTTFQTNTGTRPMAMASGKGSDSTSKKVRWFMARDLSSSPGTLEFSYSVGGAAPVSVPGMNITGVSPNAQASASMFIDEDDYMWVAYVNQSTGRVTVARGLPNTAHTSYTWLWHEGFLLGTPGAGTCVVDLTAHRHEDDHIAHVVWAPLGGTARIGRIRGGGGTSRTMEDNGSQLPKYGNVHGITVDFHHQQSKPKSVLGSSPHVYVFTAENIPEAFTGDPSAYFHAMRINYSGGGWSPASPTRSLGRYSTDEQLAVGNIVGYWDGTACVMTLAVPATGGPLAVILYQWIPGSTIIELAIGSMGTTPMRGVGIAYDTANRDVHVMAVDTSGNLRWRRFSRALNSWGGGAATVDTVAGYVAPTGDITHLQTDRYSGSDSSLYVVGVSGSFSPYSWFYSKMADLNLAPLAAVIFSHTSGDHVNMAPGWFLGIEHRDPNGDKMNGYALRRKVGAGAYEYWNPSVAGWSGSVVWNGVSEREDHTISFPPTTWANGTTYDISAATRDTFGVTGPFNSDIQIVGINPPTANVTAPTGTTTSTNRPEANMTYGTSGVAQQGFQFKLFTQDQFSAGGFSPDTSTALFDTGVVPGTANRAAPPEPLENGKTYRIYGRVVSVGNQWSNWDFETFTLSLVLPDPPQFTATPDPERGIVTLSIKTQANMLTADQSTFENTMDGWMAGPSTSITRIAVSKVGNWSMRLTRNGSQGLATANLVMSDPTVEVVAGRQYTVMGSFRAQSAPRSVQIVTRWLDNMMEMIQEDVLVGTDAVGNFNTGSLRAVYTAPVGAISVFILAQVLDAAANEHHYFDAAGIFPGDVSTWSIGDRLPLMEVSYSDDGVTWLPLTEGDVSMGHMGIQELTLEDAAIPSGATRQYRAASKVDV